MTAYDAIVIGTGRAGPYVTSRLASARMKVAVIECNAFGGTCLNTGCIPTKTMGPPRSWACGRTASELCQNHRPPSVPNAHNSGGHPRKRLRLLSMVTDRGQ